MKIIERTHDIKTGETTDIERDETAAETKARLDREAEIAQRQAEAEDKATAKAALLTKLGITAEEAQLLLGGN
jgi:hypothetical protein